MNLSQCKIYNLQILTVVSVKPATTGKTNFESLPGPYYHTFTIFISHKTLKNNELKKTKGLITHTLLKFIGIKRYRFDFAENNNLTNAFFGRRWLELKV
jgi:hypothetical protein